MSIDWGYLFRILPLPGLIKRLQREWDTIHKDDPRGEFIVRSLQPQFRRWDEMSLIAGQVTLSGIDFNLHLNNARSVDCCCCCTPRSADAANNNNKQQQLVVQTHRADICIASIARLILQFPVRIVCVCVCVLLQIFA